MLQMLLVIFILIPISIAIGTFIAQFLTIALMYLSTGIGSLIHRAIKGKPSTEWIGPEYLSALQMIIIMGLTYSVILSVWGQAFNWGWLITISAFMNALFGSLLAIDLLALIVLSTIHGSFNVLGE